MEGTALESFELFVTENVIVEQVFEMSRICIQNDRSGIYEFPMVIKMVS